MPDVGGMAPMAGGLAQAVGRKTDCATGRIAHAVRMPFAVVAVVEGKLMAVDSQGFAFKQAAVEPLVGPGAARLAAGGAARGGFKQAIGQIVEVLIAGAGWIQFGGQTVAGIVLIADLAAAGQAGFWRTTTALGQPFGLPRKVAGPVVAVGGGGGFRAGVAAQLMVRIVAERVCNRQMLALIAAVLNHAQRDRKSTRLNSSHVAIS